MGKLCLGQNMVTNASQGTGEKGIFITTYYELIWKSLCFGHLKKPEKRGTWKLATSNIKEYLSLFSFCH